MRRTRDSVSAVLCMLVALGPFGAAGAQTFEGTAEYRDITVYGDVVEELLGWPDEVDPEQAFGLSIDRLLEATGTHGDRVEVEEMTFTIKGPKFRVETAQGYAVMDSESGVVRLVQPSQRTYIEFTPEGMEGMQERAGQMREQTMSDLPPEVRAQVEEEMGADAARAAEASVRELGGGGDVNGVPTTLYEVRIGDEVSRAWLTDRYGSLREAFRAFTEWSASMADDDDEVDPMVPLLEEGLPVRTVTFDTYSNELQMGDLLSVDEGSVPADAFVIPSDYTKQTFPGMPGEE